MDWSLISQRRSRLTVPISAILDEYGPFTLSSLMQYLKDSDIPGPFPMRDSIKGAKWLGEGAQFQVYGRHFLVEKDFEAFDKPYLESGRPRGQWGLIETTMECVAVKRAKILAPQVPHGSQPLTDLTRHAVGLNQLRDTIQEVLCLTSPPLRQHPNIVKLLAWGYDNHEERGENSFSPLLFMEQATMSLGVMCRTSEIPTGVKQHLCRGTAAGIKALHEYFIIHGDVKPDNVLVFASRRDHFSCTAKIADFGHSVRDFNQDTLTPDIAPQGTEGWSAPELRNQRTLRTDLLYRCDIWSLAMTIWSVLSTRGEKPCLSQCHRPGEFPFECEGTDVPWSLLQTLCQPLAEMVVSDPVDRIAHVENILKALELSSYKLTAEERSSFMQNFKDQTDWDTLDKESEMAQTEMFRLNQKIDLPTHNYERIRSARRSWAHRSQGALDLAARDDLLRRHLITERISMSDMFNIALSSCLDGHYHDETSFLRQCAQGGYLPAKAICQQVLDARSEAQQVENGEIMHSWLTEATESGYLYLMWFPESLPQESHGAMQRFRDAGGYNTHYCGVVPNASEENRRRGLLGDLSKDLHSHPLHLAAAFNELHLPTGPSSVLEGADMNTKDKWGDTALMKCCMAGHLEAMSILVENGAKAHLNETDGLTPLHWLFVFADDEIEEAARLLSLAGADFHDLYYAKGIEAFHFPFAWPSGGPLHWATFASNATAVRTLVSHGVPIDQKDAAHQTSLHIAMKMLNIPMIELLLKLGADLHTLRGGRDEDDFVDELSADPLRTPVHDFIWASLEIGSDPDMGDWDSANVHIPTGYEYFIFANNRRIEKTLETLRLITKHTAKCLTWKDSSSLTPLHYLLAHGPAHPVFIQFHLDHGAVVDDLKEHEVSVTALVFERGSFADVVDDARRRFGDDEISAIIRQLVHGLTPVRRKWLLNRIEPNFSELIRRKNNFRPLHHAASSGLPQTARTLIELGADLDVQSINGHTPLDIAKMMHARDEPLPFTATYTAGRPHTKSSERQAQIYQKYLDEAWEKRKNGWIAVLRVLEDSIKDSSTEVYNDVFNSV